jgi:hypothetical protein
MNNVTQQQWCIGQEAGQFRHSMLTKRHFVGPLELARAIYLRLGDWVTIDRLDTPGSFRTSSELTT